MMEDVVSTGSYGSFLAQQLARRQILVRQLFFFDVAIGFCPRVRCRIFGACAASTGSRRRGGSKRSGELTKTRLDVRLVELGLCPSRERAKTTIMSGVVFVDQQKADKPGMPVSDQAVVEVRGPQLAYASRGGYKLEKALDEFAVDPAGLCAVDIGASPRVYRLPALTRRGQGLRHRCGLRAIAWKLRNDPRVVCMERTNIAMSPGSRLPMPPTLR